MSVRLARLLSVALIGACLTTPVLAKTSHAHGHGKSSAAAKGPTLIWRGDVATAQGVVNEVARAWEQAGHGRIELQPFNTASGIDAVASGSADLAGAARASDGSAENANLTFTPVAWDALVIVVQASNPVHSLTLKQVHDIYYGKITNWSELGGNNAPIDVYAVASPGDGVEYSLRDLLFGRGNQPVAAPRLYVNTHKLEEGVALNPNGMGASTLADISGNTQLRAVAIDGVAPSASSLASGSYQLFTPLYLVTNARNPKAAQVEAFIDFLQTEPAKAAMRSHSVLPYQDGSALVALDSSRRGGMLAAVGARASHVVAARPTPISAPGATYASRAAMAPTSPDTLAAKLALDRRRSAEASEKTALDDVKGGVAGVTVSSLARVKATASSKGRLAGSTGASAASTGSDADGKVYTVAKGDTLLSIARTHAVDVAQLRQWNHLKGNQIKLGQRLRVGHD